MKNKNTSESFYTKLITHLEVGIAVTNRKGNIEYVNPFFAKMLGYQIESAELLNLRFIDLVADSPENSPFFEKHQKGFLFNENADTDLLMKTKTGDLIWEKVHIQPMEADDSNDTRILISLRSTAKERNIKNKLLLAKEHAQSMYKHYKALMDAMPDLIFRMDSEGTYLDFHTNEQNEKDLVVPAHELLGKTVFEVLPEKNALLFYDFIQKTLDTGELQVFEDHIVQHDKTEYYDCRIVKSDHNEVIAIIRNITERSLYEKKLTMANERIRRSERAKEMFLANTSHEIRTPMNAIIGLVELLKKTKLAKKQSEYLNIIEQSSENLLHILNDILDMSKIESEKMHLEYKAFNLMEVLNDSINTLMIKAKEKGLILELNCPKGCRDFVVLGDRVRLAQIIINLVNNAIKFTDRGKIQINIEQLEENKENFRFRFSVKDTGIGIAEERQKQVFQEFVQADDSTTRLYGGTGLGLSISQHLVSLMGGKLALKSKLGEGSEFFFTLQLEKADKKPIQELPRSAKPMDLEKNLVAGKKVLLVEDNAFNRLVAGKMLKELGLEYQEAENGREAIQKLKAHSFDLVLMDIQMPVMDGITATRSIRDEMEKPLSEIPIIALTAHALKGDREKYKAMGMTDYISKPYRMTQLRDILQKVLANTATASDLDTSQSEEPAKNFDLSQIEEIANGDLHFVAQMIETFTEPSIQTLNKLKHLLKEAQFSEIKKKLHAIKPGFGMFGRDDLVEQVAHLEKLCESDQTEQIQEKLNQFESEMRPLFEALKLKANRLKSKT